jgi:hypothetical protein
MLRWHILQVGPTVQQKFNLLCCASGPTSRHSKNVSPFCDPPIGSGYVKNSREIIIKRAHSGTQTHNVTNGTSLVPFLARLQAETADDNQELHPRATQVLKVQSSITHMYVMFPCSYKMQGAVHCCIDYWTPWPTKPSYLFQTLPTILVFR